MPRSGNSCSPTMIRTPQATRPCRLTCGCKCDSTLLHMLTAHCVDAKSSHSCVQVGEAFLKPGNGTPDGHALAACQTLQLELAEEVEQLQVSVAAVPTNTEDESCISSSTNGGIQTTGTTLLQPVTEARHASAERSAQLVAAEAARQTLGARLDILSNVRACAETATAHMKLMAAQVAAVEARWGPSPAYGTC